MIAKSTPHERGQTMVLVGLMILTFIAILALVLDGGLAYASRRKAQNAADAGALAGAAELCHGGTAASAKTVAETYAITNNLATMASATITNTTSSSGTTRLVKVDATVAYSTTFAAVLGMPSGKALATARAGCFPVCGSTAVLPVAWSCRSPVGLPESSNCQIAFGPGNTYIVMDNLKLAVDAKCISAGGSIDCDLNNDGVDDMSVGGDRSWLDLTGNDAPSDTKSYLLGGFGGVVTQHWWLSGNDGVADTIFQTAATLVNKTVTVPVFDLKCKPDPNAVPPIVCPPNPLPHPIEDNIDHIAQAGSSTDYHIIAFADFKITCVADKPSDVCAGKNAFAATNPMSQGDFQSFKRSRAISLKAQAPTCSPARSPWGQRTSNLMSST